MYINQRSSANHHNKSLRVVNKFTHRQKSIILRCEIISNKTVADIDISLMHIFI